MKTTYFFVLSLVISTIIQAQVTLNPSFPTRSDDVTVTFDASQGSMGLKDFTGDVYAHTGVLTDQSSSNSDWKYVKTDWGVDDPDVKMTRKGTNLYELSFNIDDFYGVPADEAITHLNFVFRNVDGTLEGKGTGNVDIIVPISQGGFSTLLVQPADSRVVVAENEMINIKAEASESATFTVKEDEAILFQKTGTVLDSFIVAQSGFHNISIEITSGANSDTLSFSYLVANADAVVEQSAPRPNEAGIFYPSETSVLLQLYAKDKSYIHVVGDFNDWTPTDDFLMKRTPDGEYYWLEIEGLESGKQYGFQYLVEGNLLVADPHSTLILDRFSDGSIPASVNSDFPAYPDGKTTQLVGVLQPGAPTYDWKNDNFNKTEKTKLNIYEVLMRDFLEESSYENLKDTLSYFKRLGVNAIQLMPVNEFENNDSWGYNPSFHMALDKYYGNVESFKAFVDAAHALDIAVILDVVYNHAFGQSTLARLYWDETNNRPSENSPYANPIAKHPFNVGFDLNHESQPLIDYVNQCLRFWQEEYHIDGYRFDLSKGFTQKQSNDVGAWNVKDDQRIATLKAYYDTIVAINSDAYVILEHLGGVSEEKELSEYGFMLWNNINHDFRNVARGSTGNLNGMVPSDRGINELHLIGYMESHDEERLMYESLQHGLSSGDYNLKNIETALERTEMLTALYYSIPGPKMLWQFGEQGFDFSINRCENGTVNGDCRLSRKPIRWDYLENENRLHLFEVTAAMMKLRNEHEIFHDENFEYSLDGTVKNIHLKNETQEIYTFGNASLSNEVLNLTFDEDGTWYEYFTNDSLNVVNGRFSISLEPGGYALYSKQRLREEGEKLFTNIDESLSKVLIDANIFPNPTSEKLTIQYQFSKKVDFKLEILDLQGRSLEVSNFENVIGNFEHSFNISALQNGIYFLRLASSEGIMIEPIVKK